MRTPTTDVSELADEAAIQKARRVLRHTVAFQARLRGPFCKQHHGPHLVTTETPTLDEYVVRCYREVLVSNAIIQQTVDGIKTEKWK